MPAKPEWRDSLEARKRPIRVLALLEALADASIFEAPLRVVHELAYLSNVLAPVFELAPFSASLLKRQGGPYYPELQDTIDLLVGRGMVFASGIRYEPVPEEKRYRLHANYRINRALAGSALAAYHEVYADTGEPFFIGELCAAYSMLADQELGQAFRFDARYADKDVDNNEVIDFGQWVSAASTNFSRNAAMSFRPGESLQPAERIFMYIEHVQRKVAHGG
ncbi:hypothetical protein [Cupriavidus metallidurans]|uniref:Uncharacterized protein n=1 Tax=Cupriavidus metallidurans (strain ATCC 43123 / DSM 2839 / NBRC 102507 / CH34) TaxID=266264 RepID=Q1LJH2_CUPMC|nr:hypothetical protein [Cupriavidus metallidurans]ABF09704.1 hypothetical protein Rmet_2831 [Cupriavidus metallidurans CH34]QGS29458.1 hypothetical protein FOB83_11475 [Cupriavidus metallidurans]